MVSASNASAASRQAHLEVSGWIPYWRDGDGVADAKKLLADIDTIHPFAFTVTTGGELRDQAGLSDSDWRSLMRSARRKDVEVIPTVMWSDGARIHAVLSSTTARSVHIKGIVDMVKDGKYDGVDIDYEGKKAETIDFYSLFLKELKAKLGKKLLTCTIEARTPPESLYRVVPEVIEYANDYAAIGKYCDRIELMTYDQQRADILLNDTRKGYPYMPVADADWVRKVVTLALKDLPKGKVMLGVPTYGHHYTVTAAPEWYKTYTRIGALNIPDMLDLAKEYKVTPGRNSAGEMSYTYFATTSPFVLLNSLPTPAGTPVGMEAAAKALLFANATNLNVPFNIAWYSDASAIKQKFDLAKEFGLRGVAVFKIDGEEDPKVWDYLD